MCPLESQRLAHNQRTQSTRSFQPTSSETENHHPYVKESNHKYPASGACNNYSQPLTVTLDLLSNALFLLEAVVDQDLAKPKDPTKLDPQRYLPVPSFI